MPGEEGWLPMAEAPNVIEVTAGEVAEELKRRRAPAAAPLPIAAQ